MLTFGPVEIVPTILSHLPGFWSILRDWPDFWAEQGAVTDEAEFIEWYGKVAKDSLTGLDKGKVVGGAYLDAVYPGFYASVNIFKRKGYLNPKMVSEVFKTGLPIWFEKYNLEKIIGITRHKGAIRLLKRVGLTVDGTLRHHRQVNGVWQDYIISSILRGEL
jgi:RimJ/RimL family protein N-acetyltransferase